MNASMQRIQLPLCAARNNRRPAFSCDPAIATFRRAEVAARLENRGRRVNRRLVASPTAGRAESGRRLTSGATLAQAAALAAKT